MEIRLPFWSRYLLAAPKFADEEKTRRASLLHILLLTSMTLAAVAAIVFLVVSTHPLPAVAISSIIVVKELGLLALMRRGHIDLASILFPLLLWLLVTLTTFFFGGVTEPVFSAYILIIIIAGLLLGGRAGFAFAGMSILAGVGLRAAEYSSALPGPLTPSSPTSALALEVVYFIAAALLLYVAVRDLKNAMARSRRVEEALRESEERYMLAVRGANDGLWDWDLDAETIYFSPRWKTMLGHEDSEIGNTPDEWFSRVHPDDREQLQVEMAAHLNGATDHFENEHRIQHKDGSYRWMLSRGLAVRDAQGHAYRIAGSQTDITEQKRAEEQLLHDAFHDGLTGLPNRALFMDRLRHAVERKKRREEWDFAVLFLDLDRFKTINDSLGHLVADKLLVAIANRLQECIRPIDTVARFAGDEFVVLLEEIEKLDYAIEITERIQERIRAPFNVEGREIVITASIGIARSNENRHRPEEILRDADIAMYRAKALGKAQYLVFEERMRTRALARLTLETDLRRALERDELQLVYQPIVALRSGRLVGFEALLRWNHPTHGVIRPSEFISLAEETGLIIPIGQWVLRQACRQLRDLQIQFPQSPPLTVSVNVSIKQFTQPELIENIEHILDETGVEGTSLKIEVTESVLVEEQEIEAIIGKLKHLHNLGIQVHVDDFGTGYSSLGNLQRLPVDTIKIDRSFVHTLNGQNSNTDIVQMILALARKLHMEVIAEGVETDAQLEHLKGLECAYGQGYFISKPLSTGEMRAFLRRHRQEAD